MVQMRESTFLSSDGKTPIYYREYIPSSEPKGIIQLAHGIAEYIQRYDAFARFLCENGYIVAGNNHLGHGPTADETVLGWCGEAGGWEAMVEDLHSLHKLLRKEHPGLPCYLFGHSMGSFLVRTFIIRFRGSLDGAVLCGTGHQPIQMLRVGFDTARLVCRKNGTHFKSKLLQTLLFGQNNKGIENARSAFDWLSRDEDVVSAYVEDPLCGFLPSAGLVRDMLGGMCFIEKPRNLERMTKDLPVLFISGDKDPVGEYGKGVMRAYKAFLRVGMKDVTMKLYSGARHELLNETNREEVYEEVLQWFDAKCGR